MQNGPSSLFTSRSYNSQSSSFTSAQFKRSAPKDTESMTRIHDRDLENSVNERSISDGNEGREY